MRVFTDVPLHVPVELLSGLVVLADATLIVLGTHDLLDVNFLYRMVLDDAQMVDDNLAEQPLFIVNSLV